MRFSGIPLWQTKPDSGNLNDSTSAANRNGSLVPSIADNVITISNVSRSSLAGATRLRISIDRRTGMLVETDAEGPHRWT